MLAACGFNIDVCANIALLRRNIHSQIDLKRLKHIYN
jgi:hypothetical protein